MSAAISAADANREFSKLLRQVREGRSFTVTSHGRPVARIVPVSTADATRQHARATLLARLERATPRTLGAFTRDELYGRGSGDDE